MLFTFTDFLRCRYIDDSRPIPDLLNVVANFTRILRRKQESFKVKPMAELSPSHKPSVGINFRFLETQRTDFQTRLQPNVGKNAFALQ